MTDVEALERYYGGKAEYSCGRLRSIAKRPVQMSGDKILKIGTDRVDCMGGAISAVGGNRVVRSQGETAQIGPVRIRR